MIGLDSGFPGGAAGRHPFRRVLRDAHRRRGRYTCPACGGVVRNDGHAVHWHGDAYHAECALYRREASLR